MTEGVESLRRLCLKHFVKNVELGEQFISTDGMPTDVLRLSVCFVSLINYSEFCTCAIEHGLVPTFISLDINKHILDLQSKISSLTSHVADLEKKLAYAQNTFDWTIEDCVEVATGLGARINMELDNDISQGLSSTSLTPEVLLEITPTTWLSQRNLILCTFLEAATRNKGRTADEKKYQLSLSNAVDATYKARNAR